MRRLRARLDEPWNAITPLSRQAIATELAHDEVPWLLDQLERLLDETDTLRAQLDDCQERLERR